AGNLDVAQNSVRRSVGTSCVCEGDARFFIEERGRALTRERELGALQSKDGVGRGVQTFLRRTTALSNLRLNGLTGKSRDTDQVTQRKNRECVFHFRCYSFFLPVHFIVPMPFIFALPFAMTSPRMEPFIVRGRIPCGVGMLDVTLSDVPSSVPVKGASPIWLLSVPLNFPPSWLIVAVARTSPLGVLKVKSHFP